MDTLKSKVKIIVHYSWSGTLWKKIVFILVFSLFHPVCWCYAKGSTYWVYADSYNLAECSSRTSDNAWMYNTWVILGSGSSQYVNLLGRGVCTAGETLYGTVVYKYVCYYDGTGWQGPLRDPAFVGAHWNIYWNIAHAGPGARIDPTGGSSRPPDAECPVWTWDEDRNLGPPCSPHECCE